MPAPFADMARPAAKIVAVARHRRPAAGSGGPHQAPPSPGPAIPAAAAPTGPARESRNDTSWATGGTGGAAHQVLAAYTARAAELFARIERCLATNADHAALSAPVCDLADDLASVLSPEPLIKALRELAEALRRSRDPRPELAAARKAFAGAVVPPAPGRVRRRDWWRTPGS